MTQLKRIFFSLLFEFVIIVMKQQEINTIITLLEKEITRLNEHYHILLMQDKKFPELKNVKKQLREVTEELNLFKKNYRIQE